MSHVIGGPANPGISDARDTRVPAPVRPCGFYPTFRNCNIIETACGRQLLSDNFPRAGGNICKIIGVASPA